MKGRVVRSPDGAKVRITSAIIQHVTRKHPDVLRILGVSEDGLVKLLSSAVSAPDEIYVDDEGSLFFLLRADDLRLCVIVREGLARTAYLIGERTYARMRRKRWLRRLY